MSELVTVRELRADDDVDALVQIALAAWAPISPSTARPWVRICSFSYPDWPSKKEARYAEPVSRAARPRSVWPSRGARWWVLPLLSRSRKGHSRDRQQRGAPVAAGSGIGPRCTNTFLGGCASGAYNTSRCTRDWTRPTRRRAVPTRRLALTRNSPRLRISANCDDERKRAMRDARAGYCAIRHLCRGAMVSARWARRCCALSIFSRRAGQAIWQILPLGPTGYGDSPYQPFSAFAGNPLLIGLDRVREEGLLHEADLSHRDPFAEDRVLYGPVIDFKHRVLRLSYENARRARVPYVLRRRAITIAMRIGWRISPCSWP